MVGRGYTQLVVWMAHDPVALTGTQFNQRYADRRLIMLTDQLETLYGYTYQTGLNVIPSGQRGSLHFCLVEELGHWLTDAHHYARSVEIPNESVIHISRTGHRFRTNQAVLGQRVNVADLDVWDNFDFNRQTALINSRTLRLIRNGFEEIATLVLRQHGDSIQHIDHPTEFQSLTAVGNNGRSLRFIQHQTESMALMAVTICGDNLRYVKNQTTTVCLAAIRNHPSALREIHHQTEELCLAAVKLEGFTLRHVRHQTLKVCLEAFKEDPASIIFADDPIAVLKAVFGF